MDDTDLKGLSVADARAYVMEFMTSLKAVQRDIATLDADAALWIKRVELAVSKGAAELEAAARAKAEELALKRTALEAERSDLEGKITRMREKLPMVSASERSVDPDLLLAQMQMTTGEAMGGPSPSLDKGLKSLEADDALAALKRKLSGSAAPPPAPPADATPPAPPADVPPVPPAPPPSEPPKAPGA